MKTLQEIINRSKRIVFFGGAGVSTESGIPDFRGSEGLFRREFGELTAEMILSNSFFYLHPDRFYQFYRKYMLHPEAKPNAAHRKLYELEQKKKLRGIVTQNIDGLHRKAGNRLVYEIHGTVHENICMGCGKEYSLEWLLSTEGVPRCEVCGDVIKPNVTLYGEVPDQWTCMGARREIRNCDTLIVAGTSLQVEPAASMVDLFSGKELVVIDRDENPIDERATLMIRGSIAEVMEELII